MPHTRRLFVVVLCFVFFVILVSFTRTPPPSSSSSSLPPDLNPVDDYDHDDDPSYATNAPVPDPDDAIVKMGSAGPKPPLRLAILEADKPQPKADEKWGGYGGVFTELLTVAAQSMSPPQSISDIAKISAHDIVNDMDAYPSLEDVDAVLISGSRHNAFDDDEWIKKLTAYTKEAVDTGRVRVVGVCFGHQIVARAMGAKVGRSTEGWEVAVTDVDLTDEGKKIFGLNEMHIQQMHKDIVQELPPDSVLLGSNAKCAVQGMYRAGRFITVQGHPEFTHEIMVEILTNRHAAGVFDDDDFAEGMTRAPSPHDGYAIARTFIKFMQEG